MPNLKRFVSFRMLKASFAKLEFCETSIIFSRNTNLVSHEILKNFERKKLECQPYLQICALDNSLTLRQRDNYTTALSENVAILLAFKAVSGCHSCRVRPALKMTLEYKISKMFKKYFPNSLAKDKRLFQKYVFNLRIKIVVFSQFQLKFRQMRIFKVFLLF